MTSNSNIEQFIQGHRPDFDTASVPVCEWEPVKRILDRWEHLDDMERWIALERPCMNAEEPSSTLWTRIEAQLRPVPSVSIEHFISQHRDDFDTEIPNDQVFDRIFGAAAPAAPNLRVSWYSRLSRVAAAIVFIAGGAALGLWYSASGHPDGMRMAQVSPAYAELENHYVSEIEGKERQLARYAHLPSSAQVMDDLSQMDKIMEELRVELANVPPGNREQVVRAMIEHYKTKATVLERVISALEENNDAPASSEPDSMSNKHEFKHI